MVAIKDGMRVVYGYHEDRMNPKFLTKLGKTIDTSSWSYDLRDAMHLPYGKAYRIVRKFNDSFDTGPRLFGMT